MHFVCLSLSDANRIGSYVLICSSANSSTVSLSEVQMDGESISF